MLETLDLVNQVAEEYPPETGHESRFGNPAFRKFYDQIGLVSGRKSEGMISALRVEKKNCCISH
jgi:serine/threonine-protein phosphatase 2A activator